MLLIKCRTAFGALVSALPPPVPDDYNPYRPPAAIVDLPAPASQLASRGQRFGAFVLDNLVIGVLGIVAAIVLPLAQDRPQLMPFAIGLLGAFIVVYATINLTLIYRHGQTIGKRLLGIRVVRSSGERVSFGRYVFLRVLPIGILSNIPFIGLLFFLLDSLLIFREEHKCLHDDFADTLVVAC